MSELGALLRKARNERGLSLDDIQELTKIRKRYLEAIEAGDHSVLPGSFYVRAFVKNYSEAVGLEPEEVLRLYQHEVPASAVEQSSEPIPVRKPRKMKSRGSERLGKIGFNLLMWSFLVLIIVLVWYYAFNKESDEPEKADNTKITEKTQTPEPSSVAGAVTPTPTATPPTPTQDPTTVTFSSKVGKVDKYDIGPADGVHKVELKVKGGRNWVEVRAGSATGEKLYYTNAEDGAVLNYELKDTPLYINVGRSDFTEVRVDGIIVPDGDRSSSKKLLLSPILKEAEDTVGTESLTGE